MKHAFENRLRERLDELERQHLIRQPPVIERRHGPWVTVQNDTAPPHAARPSETERTLCLSSNDYLGLARHPRLLEALHRAVDEHGAGATASRLVVGTWQAHERAEHAIASFFQTEGAVLFSSGYAANVGVLQALSEPGDLILSDALNHASIIDGCRLARADVHVFPHLEADHVAAHLRRERHRYRNVFVVTESVFSMDGDAAPLAELLDITHQYGACLMVDEAHSAGVVGPQGRGACAAASVRPDVLVTPFGKAFGLWGAAVAGSAQLCAALRHFARSYMFSTAPGPALGDALVAATELVQDGDHLRARVAAHGRALRAGLRAAGLTVPDGSSPIVPVIVGTPERALALSAKLRNRGVLAQPIRPPTVPEGTARLRLVPTAAHTADDITCAIDRVASAWAELSS
jgi:8-amino-7-oxononanoate synthase